MRSLFGKCSIVKNKKMGILFDDGLGWGMMFAGVVGTIEDILLPKILELALHMPAFELTNESVNPLIWRPWAPLLPL